MVKRMARRFLGSLQISGHILDAVESAVRYSFEARRGKLYNALRALNALLIVDLAQQATEDFTRRELEELAWKSLHAQMEQELAEQFRFAYVVGMARRKFKDLDGVIQALEKLLPEFKAEFETRSAEGKLARKTGILRWLTGTEEIGTIEELLRFCEASLWLAERVLDEDSAFEHLAPKVTELAATLPE